MMSADGQKSVVTDDTVQVALPPGTVILDTVSKKFRKRTITKQSYTTVKADLIARLLKRTKQQPNYTVALHDFSIQLNPGSSLGIIGRNGSGKSTLLKLISGIYHPDSGHVRTAGRISALIELGAGFHPDFTGRENIYLGGIMYGLSRLEIDERFDRIVRYAELEDFIDDPVRTYSSGMYMRLGFSLAVHTEPDILLIDEVLAVGDAGFISRCHETISEFKRRGKTLIFVTHDLNAVCRWCDEAVWLEQGAIKDRGKPRRVIDYYLQHIEQEERKALNELNAEEEQSRDEVQPAIPQSIEEKRWGSKDVEITDVRMFNSAGEQTWLFHADEQVTVDVSYVIHREVKDLVFGVGLLRADGLEVHGANTDIDRLAVPVPAPGSSYPVSGSWRYKMTRLGLLENSYYLDVAAHKSDGFPFDYHHRLYKFSVRSPHPYAGVYVPAHSWEIIANYPSRRTEEGEEHATELA